MEIVIGKLVGLLESKQVFLLDVGGSTQLCLFCNDSVSCSITAWGPTSILCHNSKRKKKIGKF